MYLFTSERLGFRQWQASDLAPFAAMNADADMMRFFPAPLTYEESQASFERVRQAIDKFGYGFYAVDRLAEGDFIGFIGLKNLPTKAYFEASLEIGWRLQRDLWNKGYATEGAKRCLQYGFDTLKAGKICAYTALQNAPSERVMQKIGMKRTGTFPHPNVPDDSHVKMHVFYTLTQQDYRHNTAL